MRFFAALFPRGAPFSTACPQSTTRGAANATSAQHCSSCPTVWGVVAGLPCQPHVPPPRAHLEAVVLVLEVPDGELQCFDLLQQEGGILHLHRPRAAPGCLPGSHACRKAHGVTRTAWCSTTVGAGSSAPRFVPPRALRGTADELRSCSDRAHTTPCSRQPWVLPLPVSQGCTRALWALQGPSLQPHHPRSCSPTLGAALRPKPHSL